MTGISDFVQQSHNFIMVVVKLPQAARRNRRPAFRLRSAERSYLSGVWIGRAVLKKVMARYQL
jgi:hypothetical protein